ERAVVLRKGEPLARGEVLGIDRVHAETDARRREVGEALERFAQNTIEHMREERELLSGRIQLPRFQTDFRDRSVLLVVRGVGHQRDLRALRPFIRDKRPLVVAVDGGADAVLEAGLRPDMIVGDMDSASEQALCCGAELVVHSYPDGRAPGRHRLERMGQPFKLVPAPGTSQDVALLIAAEKGARLIVSVGSQFNLVEFLDRNRRGMSSTFLTRLRVGEILVDAKGVSRLYQPRPGLTPLLVVIAAGLIALLAVVLMSPVLRDVAELLWLKLESLLGLRG
ncbi:MAG: putative cytokinetic ring protein SteA, partial [Solirubrobacteraceae bacterium]